MTRSCLLSLILVAWIALPAPADGLFPQQADVYIRGSMIPCVWRDGRPFALGTHAGRFFGIPATNDYFDLAEAVRRHGYTVRYNGRYEIDLSGSQVEEQVVQPADQDPDALFPRKTDVYIEGKMVPCVWRDDRPWALGTHAGRYFGLPATNDYFDLAEAVIKKGFTVSVRPDGFYEVETSPPPAAEPSAGAPDPQWSRAAKPRKPVGRTTGSSRSEEGEVVGALSDPFDGHVRFEVRRVKGVRTVYVYFSDEDGALLSRSAWSTFKRKLAEARFKSGSLGEDKFETIDTVNGITVKAGHSKLPKIVEKPYHGRVFRWVELKWHDQDRTAFDVLILESQMQELEDLVEAVDTKL